jgi:hypothetical protein
MSVCGSMPSPTRMRRAWSATRSTNSPYTGLCTNRRVPAQQTWPELANTAAAAQRMMEIETVADVRGLGDVLA